MMALTFLLTLLWNVEVGITVSVAVSLLLVIHRSSRARLSILVSTIPSDSQPRHSPERPLLGPHPRHKQLEANQRRSCRTRGRAAWRTHRPHPREPRLCKYDPPERAPAPSGAVRYTQASPFGHSVARTSKRARVPYGRHGTYRCERNADLFGTARELQGARGGAVFRAYEGPPDAALAQGRNCGSARGWCVPARRSQRHCPD